MKPTDQEKIIINQVIDTLVDAGVEAVYACSIPLWNWVDDTLREENTLITVHSGETKAVFIHPDLDGWVIKVPLLKGRKKDYCKIEAKIFAEAEKQGLGYYFAEEYYFATVNGVPFYIQKQVSCNSSDIIDLFVEYEKTSGNGIDPNDFKSQTAYEDALYDSAYEYDSYESIYAVLGEDERLTRFLFDDHCLNDFHSGNFGYDYRTHTYVLIDYSGY